MTESAALPQPGAAPMSLPARLVGVIVSPGATFKSIAAHPKWLGAVLVVALVVCAAQFAFLSTKVGQDATYDQQVKTMENFGVTITPEMSQGMEAGLAKAKYWTVAAILVMSFVFTAVFAGIGYVVFTSLMGGTGTFKQVMAVVAHAGAISMLGQLFTVPLNYARETVSSATNLAVFLPVPRGERGARAVCRHDRSLHHLVVDRPGHRIWRCSTAARPGLSSLRFSASMSPSRPIVAIVMRAFAGSH